MMNYLVPKSSFGLAAAGASVACFVGYCIYFDRKRRSDPLFKQKLLEKRKKANKPSTGGGSGSSSEMPDLRDTESMQRFFLQEVQLGEELLATGDIESGVEHLSNAVAVCGQAQQLLQVLQQTLPPQVFQLLIQRLPMAGQRIASSSAAGKMMTDDDLE
ncbi:Mitochondrial import receptor subunit TOM20-like protein [Lamellibrachia satsuma]|nr:Mitochondrial import receptor subunit TOM20-like protein [Lamellibrachia satsuma]